MKKRLGIILLAIICALIVPIKASAASGTIFGSSSQTMLTGTTTEGGNTVKILNKGSDTKIYLGANVTSGTLTEYKAVLKLGNSNFKYASSTKESGWTGTITPSDEGDTVTIDLKSTAGITGRKLVATINLDVSNTVASTETCTIALSGVEEEEPAPTPAATPKCKVVNGVYYDANGNEVSKEAYDKACTVQESPQTGSFLPYTIIIAGIAVASGLYLITKKNNKIYHV